jgi:hypothetical protein
VILRGQEEEEEAPKKKVVKKKPAKKGKGTHSGGHGINSTEWAEQLQNGPLCGR